MGQYFRQLVKRNNKLTVYDCQVKGYMDEKGNVDFDKYNGVKLMEHSWWNNSFMQALTANLYKNKAQVAWVGDYSDDFSWEDPDGKPDPKELCKLAWNGAEGQEIDLADMTLDDKVLVNHTKKIYLDGSKYYKMNEKDGWCIHPLSLLTACGNGLGMGDYDENYPDANQVGSWCMDEIEVLDQAPDGYTEEEYYFKEEG